MFSRGQGGIRSSWAWRRASVGGLGGKRGGAASSAPVAPKGVTVL